MTEKLTNQEALEYVTQQLPDKIDTSCKCNGKKSGIIQVYKYNFRWYIRYLCRYIVKSFYLDDAIAKMSKKLYEEI